MTDRSAWRRGWGEVWRVLLALVGGALVWVVVFGMGASVDGAEVDDLRFGAFMVADLLLGLVAIVLLPLRRMAPLAVGVVTAIIAAFSGFGGVAALIVLVSVATRRRWVEIGAVLAAGLVGFIVVETFDLHAGPPTEPGFELWYLGLAAAFTAAVIAIGWAIGSRRELLASLRERARLSDAEQQLRLAQAREHERTRIAREMHDVLAHQLSLVAMHASALRHRPDLDAEQRAEAVVVVHERAKLALDDLRQVLGVLRDPRAAAEAVPQPSLDDLDALLADEPNAHLELLVDSSAVPPTIGRHAYRIVQECLTNARKHAPGRPVTVRVEGSPGERLRISARNAVGGGSGGEPGYGLVGIDERARSVGGTATVAVSGGEHRVDVELPWAAS